MTIDYAFLAATGVRISRLALGTMPFGTQADEATSAALFRRAREAGINFFDCADVYGGGRAEEVLGALIADCRDEVVIATKGYFPSGARGPNDRGSSRYHLRRAVEASLRRLGTDRIDVYFLHRHDDVTDLEDTLRTLDDLIREGKILYPAVSNFAAWQAAKALGVAARRGFAPIVATQPMYNLVKRQAEVEILPMAASEGIAAIPYGPTGGGLLTGRYGKAARPQSGRLVDNPMYADRYAAEESFAVAERFVAVAERVGCHPAALAVAWVASHPAVTATLLGARTVEQLDGLLGAADLLESVMTDELREEIGGLSATPPPATDRNEEGGPHDYGTR